MTSRKVGCCVLGEQEDEIRSVEKKKRGGQGNFSFDTTMLTDGKKLRGEA